MTCHQPIRALVAVNHDPSPYLDERRLELAAAAWQLRDRTIQRARLAAELKLRLAYCIPYHEWQEALARKGIARELLIEAYAPRFNFVTGAWVDGPRCPPWATRRYRGAAPTGRRGSQAAGPVASDA